MDPVAFYDGDPDGYFDYTFGVDFSATRNRFVAHLPRGARVLDLGCGSCRDSCAFMDSGFDVVPVDASEGMRRVVKERLGIDVIPMRFEELPYEGEFDGVWANASLLHAPSAELPRILALIRRALKPNGVFFCSFKTGDFEGDRDGRRYTDMTSERLEGLLLSAGFRIAESWNDEDYRGTLWTNTISIHA